MPNTIDLLPPDRRRALSRDYLFRLGVVATAFCSLLVVAAIGLLVPTYLYLAGAGRTAAANLAEIESTLSSTEESALAARLSALSANAAEIEHSASEPAVSATMRELLAVPSSGIVLTGFNYVAPSGKALGTLEVSGEAATRDDLRAYQLALLSAPGVASADLPVSSYVKDANLPFTIAVTLATPPTP